MIRIDNANDDDIYFVARNLRAADKKELSLSNPELSPEENIIHSARVSEVVKMGYYNNEPCVLFGVARSEYGGIVWMVATEKINEVSKTNVARYSECAVREIESRFSFLYNYVHKDNHVSINWLIWLGFTVSDKQNEFLYFYKEVSHVRSNGSNGRYSGRINGS